MIENETIMQSSVTTPYGVNSIYLLPQRIQCGLVLSSVCLF